MQKHLIDNLTGIHNEEYLKLNYQRYMESNPNSNFIMIDFEKFKLINDTFGHNIGDEYLKIFAKILDGNFKDSIVARLHGDEFAILTKFSEEHIEKIFELCNQKILLAELEGKIPKAFKYNAGSTKAEHGINITKEKADYMMYYAKKNHMQFQKFSLPILEKKEKQEEYLNNINLSLSKDDFSYTTRQLFDKNTEPQNIFQIYTKDKNGNSIFDNGRYEILKNTSKLPQVDVYNIQRLLERIDCSDKKTIIIIDYKSLILASSILDYLKIFKDVSNKSFDNVVLSIDINNIESSHIESIINSINDLKSLGFLIRLDKFDNTIGDKIWEETNVDYIKISNEYWKKAMETFKMALSLEHKVEIYEKCKITPVFEFIEQEKELSFLKDFTSENTLFSGDYFSKEKKLVLK